MDYVYTLSGGYTNPNSDRMACAFFEFGVSADVTKILGTAQFSLSDLVSYRGTHSSGRYFESVYRNNTSGVSSASSDSRFSIECLAVEESAGIRNESTGI